MLLQSQFSPRRAERSHGRSQCGWRRGPEHPIHRLLELFGRAALHDISVMRARTHSRRTRQWRTDDDRRGNVGRFAAHGDVAASAVVLTISPAVGSTLRQLRPTCGGRLMAWPPWCASASTSIPSRAISLHLSESAGRAVMCSFTGTNRFCHHRCGALSRLAKARWRPETRQRPR
jgi:hypothetical protein